MLDIDIGLKQLLYTIWLILPAYVANGSPIISIKILGYMGIKKHPIDKGKNFVDGRRVFGDNKTWEGFITGVLAGVLTSLIQTFFSSDKYLYIIRGLVLSIGAMSGDLLGAFIKRRLGIKPGDPLPILDQVLFLLTAIMLSIATKTIDISLKQFFFAIVITIALHIFTNYLAYKLSLKEVPW